MTGHIVTSGGLTLIASLALVAATRSWARRSLLDLPNYRSLHSRPTPRGGGIGIVVSVSLALGLLAFNAPALRPAAFVIGGLALAIAALGMADDLRGLPAVPRLFAQIGAAVLFAVVAGPWNRIEWPGLPPIDAGWAAVPLTVVVLVGLTNAYNFMDGIDGIAGSQGIVAGAGWIGLGYAANDPLLAVAGSAIAAASLGFLVYNWSPASIFMGDVGASFLGFLLGALTVHTAGALPIAGLGALLFVWPFLFDTSFTLVQRTIRGENVLKAHRSHLYQRLVLTGVSHQATALLYTALASAGAVVGNLAVRGGRFGLIGLGAIAVLAVGLWILVVVRERARR